MYAVALGMANIDWSEGRREEALAGYERVVAVLRADAGATPERRALVLFTLAEALGELGREPGRARALAEEALGLYRSMGEYTPESAEKVVAWLEGHPPVE